MQNKLISLLSLLIITQLLSSCASKKTFSSSPLSELQEEKIWSAVKAGNIDFEWYYAKGVAHVDYENTSVSANIDLRIRKDSAILATFRVIGLEAGRALITKDSIFVINRLEGYYSVKALHSLRDLYNIPFSFEQLQQVIVGNHLTENQLVESFQEKDRKLAFKTTGKEIHAEFMLSADHKVESLKYKDLNNNSLEILFRDYSPVIRGKTGSWNRVYYYPDKENFEYKLEIQLNEIAVDQPKSLKFEIPSKYTRV